MLHNWKDKPLIDLTKDDRDRFVMIENEIVNINEVLTMLMIRSAGQ